MTGDIAHAIQIAVQIFKPSRMTAEAAWNHAQAVMTAAKNIDLPFIYRLTHWRTSADGEDRGLTGKLRSLQASSCLARWQPQNG